MNDASQNIMEIYRRDNMHEANPTSTHFPIPVPIMPLWTHLSAHAWWMISPLCYQCLTIQQEASYRAPAEVS